MRRFAPLLVALLAAPACDGQSSQSPTAPRESGIAGVFSATLSASPSCASELPHNARERTYTATLRYDGRLEWSGPTLNPPRGMSPISRATFGNEVFSFYIDVERDPMSEDFHGLWDQIENGTILNIWGKANGTVVRDGEITGTMNGTFVVWEPAAPPPADAWFCTAPDHRFRFVK